MVECEYVSSIPSLSIEDKQGSAEAFPLVRVSEMPLRSRQLGSGHISLKATSGWHQGMPILSYSLAVKGVGQQALFATKFAVTSSVGFAWSKVKVRGKCLRRCNLFGWVWAQQENTSHHHHFHNHCHLSQGAVATETKGGGILPQHRSGCCGAGHGGRAQCSWFLLGVSLREPFFPRSSRNRMRVL